MGVAVAGLALVQDPKEAFGDRPVPSRQPELPERAEADGDRAVV